ncbi:MAG: TIGR01212 family radical SAM protein [bacterium]
MKHILLNEHLRSKFGERVQRISLDPGFVCPNRTEERGACIFCDEDGSASPWLRKGMSITQQLERGAKFAFRRYKAKKYIAYFQAYTTTNATAEELEKIYEEALCFPGVVGIAISTRPDALSDEVVSVLEKYSKKTYLWVELGAQSMNNKSLLWMNRGHSSEIFSEAVKRLKSKGIEVVGHIIFGLPIESETETIDSFKKFIETGLDGYKIHALHIIKGTTLAKMYEDKPFKLLSLDEYISLVRKALSLTPSNIVIHRLTGEVDETRLLAPAWIREKNDIIRRILE